MILQYHLQKIAFQNKLSCFLQDFEDKGFAEPIFLLLVNPKCNNQ